MLWGGGKNESQNGCFCGFSLTTHKKEIMCHHYIFRVSKYATNEIKNMFRKLVIEVQQVKVEKISDFSGQ